MMDLTLLCALCQLIPNSLNLIDLASTVCCDAEWISIMPKSASNTSQKDHQENAQHLCNSSYYNDTDESHQVI